MEGGGGGKKMSELFHSSTILVNRARERLATLERLEFSSSFNAGADTAELFAAVKSDIMEIESLSLDMHRLFPSVADQPDGNLSRRKVEQVSEEAHSLQQSLNAYFSRNQRRMQDATEREELLERANGEYVLRIYDEEAQEMQYARNSARMLEESHATAVAILGRYAGQRERLKRAQRRALDSLNALGVSSSLLRLIERRFRVDNWIKYLGMFLVIAFVIAVWRWSG